MKRHINFFRIKVILIIAIIVFPTLFTIILVNTFTMADYGDFWSSITYENAPENTVYVDILVKLPEDSEDYVDFAVWEEPPKKLVEYKTITEPLTDNLGNPTPKTHTYTKPIYEALSITPDSEIAQLNDDGYVSLSVHHAGSRGFYDQRLYLDVLCEMSDIEKRYGKFKAAYVDENGNVLGITKTARTRYNPKDSNSFTANGDRLIFTKSELSPVQYILIHVSFFGEPLAIAALIAFIVLEQALKSKPDLPPSPNSMPRSIEERNKDNPE